MPTTASSRMSRVIIARIEKAIVEDAGAESWPAVAVLELLRKKGILHISSGIPAQPESMRSRTLPFPRSPMLFTS